MTQAAQVKGISPMIPVPDLATTLAFYRDVCGFTVVMDDPAYGVVQRDGCSVHFVPVSQEIHQKVHGHVEFYVEVADVDAYWEAHLKAHCQSHKMRAPFDREYGMREVHLADPNGVLIFFGHRIA